MAGTDGITPLNALNLIGKQSADSMNGALTMIGAAIYLQGAYISVPVVFALLTQTGNKEFYIENRSYEFPLVMLQNPSAVGWAPHSTNGVFVSPTGFDNPDPDPSGYLAFQSRRAAVLEFYPALLSQAAMYAEGDVVATA